MARKAVFGYWLEFGRRGNKCQVHHTPPDVSNMFAYYSFYRDEPEATYRYTVVIPTSRQVDIDKLRDFVRNLHEHGTYQVYNVTHSDQPITKTFRVRITHNG